MVGIIQEQHPDRARLFMQWKQMKWPILVDSLNLLEVSAVPITLFIDEEGIIRSVGPKPDDVADFLRTDFDGAEAGADVASRSEESAQAEKWHDEAVDLFLKGGDGRIDQAIDRLEKVLKAEPKNAWASFRLGVAYRGRYDSEQRRDGDFAKAIDNWNRALDIDPNQYIWRRRIQQYGPRLDKPYSFYDWVNQAREEIAARGEEPYPLRVEPGGAEFAYPADDFSPTPTSAREPDPSGRIFRDKEAFVTIEKVIVPGTQSDQFRTWRVHLFFRPNLKKKAHWNNEVDGLAFWVTPPADLNVDPQYLKLANPPEAVSQETRHLEFEVKTDTLAQASTLRAYALYYVCEDVDGTCLYRRQDISIELK
jgi:tetratricopeptide (TPR) repeat protein